MRKFWISAAVAAAGLLSGCASSQVPFRTNVVLTPNHYREADPDINVRYELRRDWARDKNN